MKDININRKETTFSEMEKVLFEKDTIILNDRIKQKVNNFKSPRRNKITEERKRKAEFLTLIQNTIIGGVMIIIMCFIWLVGINETNAYNGKNIVKTSIKRSNRTYSVQVWKDRVETMRDLGYSATRILDLLTIMNMECGSYKGDCFNGNDIGPMQINKIHKEQYNKSWEFYNNQDWGGLFVYQVKYANRLLDSYESNNCKPEYIVKYGVGDTYNQKRWRCVCFHYNGHPKHKYAYNKLGWERRSMISDIIFKKG